MSAKSLIMTREGMVRIFYRLLQDDIDSPQEIAERYDFAVPALKEDFIRGLEAGQAFRRSMQHLIARPTSEQEVEDINKALLKLAECEEA